MHTGHVCPTAPPTYTFTVGQHSCVVRAVSHTRYAKGTHTTRSTDATSHTLVTLQAVHFSCPWPGQILRPCVAAACCHAGFVCAHACQCLLECERQVLARPVQSPIVQVQVCCSRYCPCCARVWRDTLSRVGYLMLDTTIHQSALVKMVPITYPSTTPRSNRSDCFMAETPSSTFHSAQLCRSSHPASAGCAAPAPTLHKGHCRRSVQTPVASFCRTFCCLLLWCCVGGRASDVPSVAVCTGPLHSCVTLDTSVSRIVTGRA